MSEAQSSPDAAKALLDEELAGPASWMGADRVAQSRLTSEAIEALFTRPDHGLTRAALRQFESPEDFLDSMNNFGGHWGPNDSAISSMRLTPAFQRFVVLYPELHCDIKARIAAVDYRESEAMLRDTELLQRVFDAYNKMSELVDINDPNVELNGQVDRDFLLR